MSQVRSDTKGPLRAFLGSVAIPSQAPPGLWWSLLISRWTFVGLGSLGGSRRQSCFQCQRLARGECVCPYWEHRLTHSSVSLWPPWVENRQSHCVSVHESAFSFSVQIYLLKEKHICIKKP